MKTLRVVTKSAGAQYIQGADRVQYGVGVFQVLDGAYVTIAEFMCGEVVGYVWEEQLAAKQPEMTNEIPF